MTEEIITTTSRKDKTNKEFYPTNEGWAETLVLSNLRIKRFTRDLPVPFGVFSSGNPAPPPAPFTGSVFFNGQWILINRDAEGLATSIG